ncbi:MAG: sugar phosphate isomerase/epimerase [Verrucomicrobiota bacterium]
MKDPNSSLLNRRQFLKTGAAAAAACAAIHPGELLAAEGYGGHSVPIGVQLYPVRNLCAKDLPGTFASLSKMGYKAVEFADYFDRTAPQLRKCLDDAGLKCCGNHLYLDDVQGDAFARTVEFNQVLGNSTIVIRWLPEKYIGTLQSWQRTAALCNEAAEKLKPLGMRLAYHNHGFEFKPLPTGEIPFELFFRAAPEVAIQLDTGNAREAGGDPVKLLREFPGRVASLHVKPWSAKKPNALIGDDELDWKEIFQICESNDKLDWYIVEYEKDLYPPLEADQKTLEVFRKWGKC